jgi:hypothetical protein
MSKQTTDAADNLTAYGAMLKREQDSQAARRYVITCDGEYYAGGLSGVLFWTPVRGGALKMGRNTARTVCAFLKHQHSEAVKVTRIPNEDH